MKCPNCSHDLEKGLSWIEHDGIGHPGPEMYFCKNCDFSSMVLPQLKTFTYSNVTGEKQ